MQSVIKPCKNPRQTRRLVRLGQLVTLLTTSCVPLTSISGAPTECAPVRYLNDRMSISVVIEGEGPRCLIQDLRQRSAIDLDNGSQRGAPSIVVSFFRARNVDLDLQDHVVSTDPFENGTGIALSQDSSLGKIDKNIPHDLTVRNGTVTTPGKWGVGVYLGFFKDYRLATDFGGRAYARLPEDEHPMSEQAHLSSPIRFINPWNYSPPTRFTVDNVKIKSGGRGVIMVGANNVLRNSELPPEFRLPEVT